MIAITTSSSTSVNAARFCAANRSSHRARRRNTRAALHTLSFTLMAYLLCKVSSDPAALAAVVKQIGRLIRQLPRPETPPRLSRW